MTTAVEQSRISFFTMNPQWKVNRESAVTSEGRYSANETDG